MESGEGRRQTWANVTCPGENVTISRVDRPGPILFVPGENVTVSGVDRPGPILLFPRRMLLLREGGAHGP